MARLSTQPSASALTSASASLSASASGSSKYKAVALRSGFYALPLAVTSSSSSSSSKRSSSSTTGVEYIFVRAHHSFNSAQDDDHEQARAPSSSTTFFLTGLPLGATEKALQKLFKSMYPQNKIVKVQLLPSPNAASNTLLSRELASVSVTPSIDPLFITSDHESHSVLDAQSALITFESTPALPPPAPSVMPSLFIPKPKDFLARARAKYDQARPHRSLIIAHTDTWMQNHDQKKASLRPTATATAATPSSPTSTKKKGKKAASKDPGPVPGSAAFALAQYAAQQARLASASYNPDDHTGPQDAEGWTLVSRGGRHGTSALDPEAIKNATTEGYGGRGVKVASKSWLKGLDGDGATDLETGQRNIVGKGFYRFTKSDERKQELAALKDRFEQDKSRLNEFRESHRGRGGRGGRGGGSGRGPSGRGGRGGSSSRDASGRSNDGGNRYRPY
ncbi:BQ2448_4099 [Microbotryum intermedium]|uniref:BQ2448_4099 protein n=1 Tax=Microbotryum intermedium TaxID=269621 RepID=A0A238FFI4_9BASI|nr:BQ2448_4099 [Microbotryum intermedium]